jgi:hypothetical protein
LIFRAPFSRNFRTVSCQLKFCVLLNQIL